MLYEKNISLKDISFPFHHLFPDSKIISNTFKVLLQIFEYHRVALVVEYETEIG